MNGFSDEDRDRIREELIETGRELLIRYGPKKTNVADVTEPVGIAKSTFYLFFESKSDLYLEIMRRESEAFVENAERALEGVEDPREGLERLFRCYRDFAAANPLIQQMIAQDAYRELFRNVPSDRLEKIEQEGMADVTPFIERLQSQSTGQFANLDPAAVVGVMGTIGLLILHHEEFEEYGDEYYEQVQELLITSLSAGLTAE